MGQLFVVSHQGDFRNTTKFLDAISNGRFLDNRLNYYAEKGLRALTQATPQDSGKTADSWGYVIERSDGSITITWTNDNMAGRVPVAILIQYGHATRSGAYVQGRDFINPAMQPIFDEMADKLWKEVTNA